MGKLKQLVLTLGLSLTLVGCGVVTESTDVEDRASATQVESSVKTEDRNTEESTKESTSGLVIDEGYTYLETEGGDTSGHREPLTVTNIGFGDREYFAYTNEYGQLVRVTAKEIILQDDDNEPVKSNGRYYNNMANVPGTEQSNLDKGHIIADSLGGVSNAYNITPQESTLNRHGDQAYMERVIRDAGGATDFTAIITYPNTTTQIPSHYEYTYTVNGNTVTDSFDNLNPDELNEALGLTTPQEESKQEESTNTTATTSGEYVDENGNGLIKGSSSGIYHTPGSSYYDKTTNPKALFKTVQEAEDAGYRAPKR